MWRTSEVSSRPCSHTSVIDTLPLVKSYFKKIIDLDMKMPELPIELRGKHSLEAWGYRLGVLKGTFGKTDNWKLFTDAMATYCADDVLVNAALHEFLMEVALEQGD